ncbi:MAG: hypothetical protein EBV19_07905 [Flavobacteriia bacterium]|jgi:hypothetical protein|nr:hypothetical protein [Flavobacteriia bacterium]
MGLLCKYKDVLGRPSEGVHAWRVFDIAIVDVALTLVAAALIAAYFHLPLWQPALALFVLGIIAHRVFCVRTTVDKWLTRLLTAPKRVRFNV